MLFKIRDASGERKYLITASNLTELTLTLNKSSKNVLLKCSFIRFILYYSIVCLDFSPGVGAFLKLLIDLSPFVSHPGEFDQKNLKFVKSPPLARTPPDGVYIDRCITLGTAAKRREKTFRAGLLLDRNRKPR